MSYFTVLTELPLRDGGDVLPVPAASPPGVCPVETFRDPWVGFRPELVLPCFCVLRLRIKINHPDL